MMKLKGLKRYTVNGTSYVYHRATGVRLRSDLPEDDKKFLAAYLEAENNAGSKPKLEEIEPNSVADICRRFQVSRKFKELSKGYQNNLRRDMKRLCEEKKGAIAKVPFSAVKRHHIERQLDQLDRNPGNQRLKCWRYLTEYAVKYGIVAERATDGIKANPELNTGGHKPWTFANIQKFRDFWPNGTKARLAFELQYWTGSRISDTRRLGPRNIDQEGWLTFVQQKTGSEVSVPIKRDLPRFAEPTDLQFLFAAINAMPNREATWLATNKGNVRSEKGASQWFSANAKKAGLSGLGSHGLRKSRMILHAENGASSKEIAAWSGHETLNEIERYVKEADRRKLLTPSVLETGKFL